MSSFLVDSVFRGGCRLEYVRFHSIMSFRRKCAGGRNRDGYKMEIMIVVMRTMAVELVPMRRILAPTMRMVA